MLCSWVRQIQLKFTHSPTNTTPDLSSPVRQPQSNMCIIMVLFWGHYLIDMIYKTKLPFEASEVDFVVSWKVKVESVVKFRFNLKVKTFYHLMIYHFYKSFYCYH